MIGPSCPTMLAELFRPHSNWTDLRGSAQPDELAAFLRAAAGHRLFPALWLSANTGMRRSELLGLKWSDLDGGKKRLSINRGLVAVGYELHKSRGKTASSRRCIDLDETTLGVLAGWRAMQAAEHAAVGIDTDDWMFTTATGEPIHPHTLSQNWARRSASARASSKFSPCRTTSAPHPWVADTLTTGV
jgi:integrase